MPLISTRGAASAQGFGEFAQSAAPVYIEDVFSTYLYTGNGSTQTITNGIDLSGKGGMVWMKGRSGATDHALYDTTRGATKDLVSNSTAAETTEATGLTAFSGTGFSIGALAKLNTNAATYASWTFRKQAKFFDVVTYTGNGVVGRSITHNLGSAPGCVMIKCTSSGGSFYGWEVWHRTLSNQHGSLNSTGEFKSGIVNGVTAAEAFGNGSVVVSPTSTVFTVGGYAPTNENGQTYVAYLFAHNAGGFGLSGTDNVISCGSYTTDGSGNATVNLGYEPQWVLHKRSDSTDNWLMHDNMRGLNETSVVSLFPNLSNAESTFSPAWIRPTATGLQFTNRSANATYIYIAIRRGPMKVPTSGTSVFNTIVRAGTAANATVSGVGFSPDLAVVKGKTSGDQVAWNDRLRGTLLELMSSNTNAEISTTDTILNFTMDGASLGADATRFDYNATGHTYANWFFRRAPSFFDIVCYTGTNTLRTVNHNLGVPPELVIIKIRNSADNWEVWTSYTSMSSWYRLNENTFSFTPNYFNSVSPTSTEFTLKASGVFAVNQTGYNYVAYLFATVAGVSKVGSYTGSGTTKQIDCGFTAGARFVLIKRTDSTGDWYVYDSARGIVAGNDPYLFLNSTAAEVTSTDYVDTYSAGFELSSTAPAGLNANGGSFIFFAVA